MDVTCVGNALIDAFLRIQEKNMQARLDEANHELCFRYGEKIHVDSCDFLPGGNACNVSVGLGRFGLKSALCAEIGDDEFAQKLLAHLRKEPVDLSMVLQTNDEPSSFSVGINFKQERTLFVQHVKRAHNFSFDTAETRWFYLTSLGIEWKSAYQRVADFVKTHGTKLAFSPGTHQMEEGRESLDPILSITDMLFVNKEEGEQLAGRGRMEMKDLLHALQALGPKTVSVTDGGNGAYALAASGTMLQVDTFPNEPVEKTGAGDSYASGFLGAIVSGLDIESAMRYGAVNAASVIEHVGAQEGLLSLQEIEQRLVGRSDFGPTPL